MNMKKYLLLVLAAVISVSAFAQGLETAQKKAADNFLANIPDSLKYVSKTFMPGKVVYTNGEYSNGVFNICTIDQSVRFMSDGEELSIKDLSQVDRVTIGGQLYLKKSGSFYQVIDNLDNILLCVLKKVDIIETKNGSDVQRTSNVNTYSAFQKDGQLRNNYSLNAKYRYDEVPYMLRKNTYYMVTEKNLATFFPTRREQIREYLKDNRCTFSNPDDVYDLFQYLKQQQ